MKDVVATDLKFMQEVEHCTASFVDFEHDVTYWSNKCKCGSEVDKEHKCLGLAVGEFGETT